jgi:hypothetical protein
MSAGWDKRAPIVGIVAIVLIVAAFIVGGEPPGADDPVGEVVSYYEENDTEVGVASLLLALGAAFFAFFTAVLAGALRRPDVPGSALPLSVLAGGVMLSIGMLIFAGLGLTLSDLSGDLEPAAVQAIHALSEDLWFPVAGGTVVLSWSVALAILKGAAALPRWLGWVALVIAVASVTPAGFFAFLAIGLWILIASVVMLTSGDRDATTARGEAGPGSAG